ncbi:hypothetical protein LINGRAHAP2_LOCUS4068 [Linum grandiflorum]
MPFQLWSLPRSSCFQFGFTCCVFGNYYCLLPAAGSYPVITFLLPCNSLTSFSYFTLTSRTRSGTIEIGLLWRRLL